MYGAKTGQPDGDYEASSTTSNRRSALEYKFLLVYCLVITIQLHHPVSRHIMDFRPGDLQGVAVYAVAGSSILDGLGNIIQIVMVLITPVPGHFPIWSSGFPPRNSKMYHTSGLVTENSVSPLPAGNRHGGGNLFTVSMLRTS